MLNKVKAEARSVKLFCDESAAVTNKIIQNIYIYIPQQQK